MNQIIDKSSRYISLDEIRRNAPSVFAECPSPKVSDQYFFIDSKEIIMGLGEYGWRPVQSSQSKAKDSKNSEYQKHMLKFEHPDYDTEIGTPQFVFLNSHNRSIRFRAYVGYDIKVCSNGCVIGEVKGSFEAIHRQEYKAHMVGEWMDKVFDDIQSEQKFIDMALHTKMSHEYQLEFAEKAYVLRWSKGARVEPSQLLLARREEDDRDTVWHTFQRIQENLIRGGVEFEDTNGRETYRSLTTSITQVDRNVAINVALWNYMRKYIKTKGGQK